MGLGRKAKEWMELKFQNKAEWKSTEKERVDMSTDRKVHTLAYTIPFTAIPTFIRVPVMPVGQQLSLSIIILTLTGKCE